MSKNIFKNLPIVIKRYGEVAKEDKVMIIKMIKIIATVYINIFKEREKIRLTNIKDEYSNKTKLKMEELDKKYLNKFCKYR